MLPEEKGYFFYKKLSGFALQIGREGLFDEELFYGQTREELLLKASMQINHNKTWCNRGSGCRGWHK